MLDSSHSLPATELTGTIETSQPEGADNPAPASVRNIAELAAIAGVDASTVSRALANKPGVRRETRDRIKHLARQHGFCINVNAQSLRAGKRGVRPVTHPGHCSPFEAQPDAFTLRLLKTIFEHATRSGFDVSSKRFEIELPSEPPAENPRSGEVMQSPHGGKSACAPIAIQIILGDDRESDVGVCYHLELSARNGSPVSVANLKGRCQPDALAN